jgi:hypothetical protein
VLVSAVLDGRGTPRFTRPEQKVKLLQKIGMVDGIVELEALMRAMG